MDYKKYFFLYADSISELLKKVDTNLINASVNLIANTQKNKSRIYVIGNGGSSSIASHVSVDFVKAAGIMTNGFSFQAGAGGTSLAFAIYLREFMKEAGVKARFIRAGSTKYLVEMLEEAIENSDWDKVSEALDILSIDEDELFGYNDD